MLIRSKKPWELSENQVTPERLFLNRRQVIGALGPGTAAAALSPIVRVTEAQVPPTLKIGRRGDHADGEELNSYEEITTYNNYYEFGTDKRDPARNAHTLKTSPWSVEITGHAVHRPAET
jgi:sulfoxide reductase catalytic subunit YedY